MLFHFGNKLRSRLRLRLRLRNVRFLSFPQPQPQPQTYSNSFADVICQCVSVCVCGYNSNPCASAANWDKLAHITLDICIQRRVRFRLLKIGLFEFKHALLNFNYKGISDTLQECIKSLFGLHFLFFVPEVL